MLAYRRGTTGYRLVLVGIGVDAVLTAATQYLIIRSDLIQAQRAFVWMTGSLYNRGWEQATPVMASLVVVMELGDDAARSLGVRTETVRGGLLLCATGLTAFATAAAGPVKFVALISPQIARRLVGPGVVGLFPAAACGALLLVASDLVGRRLFAPTELPVGIVTGMVGAPYLLYLLAKANKAGSGW